MSRRKRKKGSLTVVGTGIKARFHITSEAIAALKHAEKVLYLVADTLTEHWIRRLCPSAKSLTTCYGEGKHRLESYNEMVDIILGEVRKGQRVCAAFYGHPGVGVYPTQEAVRIARDEGFEARMQPGISSEDCLFAELGIDPLNEGCQSFEATDFVIHNRRFDPRSMLILWQVGVLGNVVYRVSGKYDLRFLSVLQELLIEHYPPQHRIMLYSAATISVAEPSILKLRLKQLSQASFHGGYTMCVPPVKQTPPDPVLVRRLALA